MNLAGWSVDYVPAARVVHHIGASEGTSDRVILERHRGMIHYFRKHHRRAAPVDWIAAFLIMARARMLVLLNRLGR
jgi:GT2 family glycosyltransferase